MRKTHLILLILALLLAAIQPSKVGVAPAAEARPTQQVVTVYYDTPARLAQAASRLDIWEVNQAEGWFVALVSEPERAWLQEQGYRFQVDDARTLSINAPPDYPCYRTITTLYSDLQARAAAQPALTLLTSIGLSYEGQHIYNLRLTNEANSAAKPRFFLMANIHGREMITPETAMLFIDLLLDQYGVDPDITWLLDWHEVHVVVSANPDGHVRNETTVALWRKNTHPYGTCDPIAIGVDLNRNHSFKWGGAGSSSDPCNLIYRGPTAASEPETQAIQDYVRSLFPDQRDEEDSDAAPADATGLLISLHSYSNLVLWPWGWTATPAPNAAQLAALGRKLATFNGYTPQQATALYPTSGTSDDWSYGELGIASYTFEIGSDVDNFFPACDRYDALIQPNLQALLYAAKVARTPYLTANGPDALNLSVTPAEVMVGQPVTLTATINDSQNAGNPLSAAEYTLDLPPWAGGTPLAMQASDGVFNGISEEVEALLDTHGLAPGRHILFVRGQDIAGYWGPVSAVFLVVEYPYQSYLPAIHK